MGLTAAEMLKEAEGVYGCCFKADSSQWDFPSGRKFYCLWGNVALKLNEIVTAEQLFIV